MRSIYNTTIDPTFKKFIYKKLYEYCDTNDVAIGLINQYELQQIKNKFVDYISANLKKHKKVYNYMKSFAVREIELLDDDDVLGYIFNITQKIKPVYLERVRGIFLEVKFSTLNLNTMPRMRSFLEVLYIAYLQNIWNKNVMSLNEIKLIEKKLIKKQKQNDLEKKIHGDK